MATTQLNADNVFEGILKKGDYVVSNKDLTDGSGKHRITAGQKYKVVKILPYNYAVPSAFVIQHPTAGTWSFHFGKGGGGNYFSKVVTEPGMEVFEDYEEMPYKILQYLKQEHGPVELDDFIAKMNNEVFRVLPQDKKKTLKDTKDVIDYLIYLGYITRQGSTIFVSDKGKEPIQ